MSFRHNAKSFVPKTYDKPYIRGRGRGGFVPKTRGRGYIPSHKSLSDRRSYSRSPKRHPGGSKRRRSYSRSSSGSSLSSINASRSRSRSRGKEVRRRRHSSARKSHHASAHKSREKKKPLSPEKIRHHAEPSKTYRRPGSVIEDELASGKYREFNESTYPPEGPSGLSLLGPAIPASSYVTLRSVTSAMALPHKLRLSERFTGPLDKPFKAGENVTIGIHRNIKLPGGRIPPPVNRQFNSELFVMVHKRDYITQPIFNRDEILKFRFDVELDEQLVQEKRVVSVARDDRLSSREKRHSPFRDIDLHRVKEEDTSGYRSRISGITSSSVLDRPGLSDISRDTGLYGRVGRSPQKVSRLAPSLDPRYEQLLHEPPISDRPSLHLNPDDLRYNLMKRKQSDSGAPIDFTTTKKRYTSPLPRSPERRYDLSPRRRSPSPFERISRSLSPERLPSKQRHVIDGSRNRDISPVDFTRKPSVFSELIIPRKNSLTRERSFSRERKMSIERSPRKRSFSPVPRRSVERHSFSRSPVRKFSPVRNISRSSSRSHERRFSSEKKPSFRKKGDLSGEKQREHVSKRDEKPRREHKTFISSTHKSRDKDFSHGRGALPRGRVFRGRTFHGRGTFRGKAGFAPKTPTDVKFNPKYKIDRRTSSTNVAGSTDRSKDRAPRQRPEERRTDDHKKDDRRTDEHRKDSRRKDTHRISEDAELTDFKSQLVDLFLQQSEAEATSADEPFLLHDDPEESDEERYRPKERLDFRGRGNRGFTPRSRGSGYVRKPYTRGRYRGAAAWSRARGGRDRGTFAPRSRGFLDRYTRARSPSGKWKHDKFDRHTDAAKD